jgi:hypothetical protein
MKSKVQNKGQILPQYILKVIKVVKNEMKVKRYCL